MQEDRGIQIEVVAIFLIVLGAREIADLLPYPPLKLLKKMLTNEGYSPISLEKNVFLMFVSSFTLNYTLTAQTKCLMTIIQHEIKPT